jgi:thioredoxin reductase (NADPH)
LTAAIYAARARRKTVLFERLTPGGQIATTGAVENFPGFPESVNGLDFSLALDEQARKFGAEMRADEVTKLEREDSGAFLLHTDAGMLRARAVIVTAGAEHKKLGVPGEAQYLGRGVSHCATCDGAFFAGQDVAVVGGGDAALDEGDFLTRFAKSVTVIHRRADLRASAMLQERAFANHKMRFVWDSVVEAIEGSDGAIERVRLRNTKTGEASELPVQGVFVFIGQSPNSGLLAGLVELDGGGHAIVDLRMHTSVPGLFAAGDVRTQAARQLVSACGDGATAALAAEEWLAQLDHAARAKA